MLNWANTLLSCDRLDDLVNDYKKIHKETDRFNLECADADYNIPKH